MAALVLLGLLPMDPAPPPPPVVSGDFRGGITTTITTPGSAGGGGAAIPVGRRSGGGVSCSYAPNNGATLGVGLHARDGEGTAKPWTSLSDVPAIREALGGQMYTVACTDGTASTVWVSDTVGGAAPAGVPTLTPGQLAQQVRNSMRLPTPKVGINPDPAVRPPLVNLPQWWWVTNSPAPIKQRTALGGVWAEVTATPVSTRWTSGAEGRWEDCAGMGVVWAPGMAEDTWGHCGFTYRRAHTSETATVSVAWQVAWVGSGGSSGTFPVTDMATQVTLPVYERQAIVTGVVPGGKR